MFKCSLVILNPKFLITKKKQQKSWIVYLVKREFFSRYPVNLRMDSFSWTRTKHNNCALIKTSRTSFHFIRNLIEFVLFFFTCCFLEPCYFTLITKWNNNERENVFAIRDCVLTIFPQIPKMFVHVFFFFSFLAEHNRFNGETILIPDP